MMKSSRTFYLKRPAGRDSAMDSRLATLQQELQSVAAGMSDVQMQWHPEGKWCAAEILEHLYLSYTGTVKGFERLLEAGRPLATKPTLKNRLQSIFVLTFNYLPEGRQAPKHTVPRGLPPQQVKAQTSEAIAAMDAIITQCESRLGGGKLLDHPILGPFSADQWRKFHLLHGRHHARQIQRLRDRNF
jgi:Protein of unknown function (DUF1569)